MTHFPLVNSLRKLADSHRLLSSTVMLFAALSLIAVYAPGQSHAGSVADEIHYTITGPNSVSFDWRGDPTTITYGLTSSYGQSVVAGSPVVVKENGTTTPISPNTGSGPFREARLTGLQPGTTYHYSIGGSADQTFKTAPVAGTAGFTIAAEGDIGNPQSFSAMQTIQNQIAAQNPDVVLNLGDMSYANGNPTDGQIDAFFGNAALGATKTGTMAWSLRAAHMPSWGNHEIDHSNDNGTCTGDNLSNYKARFDFANPKEDPVYTTYCNTGGGEDWYWYDYGNTRFISYPEPWADDWKTWNTKVDSVMASAQSNPNISFIVTFGHRPAWSSGYHAGESALANFNAGLHAKYSKFVLALNGHSHNYERTVASQTGGVVHITSGGGGGYLENGSCTNGWQSVSGSCNKPAWSAFRLMHYGFTKLTFTSSTITGQFICGPAGGETVVEACTQGTVADSFTIDSPTTPTPPADTTAPTVSLTAPAANTSVSGTTTVSANASDITGIKQVEFFDGTTSLGVDTTAPYSVSWDTTKAASGLHSLTATATDSSANANKATTAASTVTVSNTTGCTLPATTLGTATTQVNVPAAGTYHVWSRVMAPDTTNNSYYLQVGSGCAAVMGDSTSIPANTWTWVDYTNGSTASKFNATFATAGVQNAVLTGKEAGVRVDRILLVADTCVPTGTGDNCVNPVDTTAPTNVAITAPAAGTTVNGQVTITATAQDNVGVGRMDFYDGTKLLGSATTPTSGSATNGTWQYVWSTSGAAAGAHSLTVKASDGLNTTTSAGVNVNIPSTTAPVVTVVSPTNGSTVQKVVGITASATTANGLTKAELYINGQLKSTINSTSSPYNFSWDTTGLAAGNYSITVKAYDNVQPANIGTSAPTTVSVSDTIAPSVPANTSASISGGQVVVTWGASTDNVGVTGYQVLRNGGIVANTSGTSYTDTAASPNTTYTYTVAAFDAAGNVSAASNSFTITVPAPSDTTAPTAPVSLSAQATSATNVDLSWGASTDNVGVAKYVVKRTNGGVQSVLAEVTAQSFTDNTAQPSTSYTYTVYAVDAAGNVSAASNGANVTTPAQPDTTAPTAPDDLSATAPSSSQVNLLWTPSTDNVGVVGYEITRNGTKLATVNQFSFGDATVIAGTTYTYGVTAIDAAGNRSPQTKTTITVPSATTTTGKNYVTNSGFEGSLTGWKSLEGSLAPLSRTSDAHTGSYAAKLTQKASKATVTLNDSPDWLKTVPSGVTSCTANAWVKTSQPGLRVVLRIRTYIGSQNTGIYMNEMLTPDTNWQHLTVTAPIKSSKSDLDLNVYATSIPYGVTYKIDDVQETCK
jgi:fibronectin type 3 domain-containing protein